MNDLGTIERAYADGYAAAQHEIERLRANCRGWYDQNIDLIQQRDKVWEENKRLREQLRDALAGMQREA